MARHYECKHHRFDFELSRLLGNVIEMTPATPSFPTPNHMCFCGVFNVTFVSPPSFPPFPFHSITAYFVFIPPVKVRKISFVVINLYCEKIKSWESRH